MTEDQEVALGKAMLALAEAERKERPEIKEMISYHCYKKHQRNGAKGGRPKAGETAEQSRERRGIRQ
jgi:hypothetical protein